MQKVYQRYTASLLPIYFIRSTPTVSFGLKLEVPVSSHFTLNYSAQDNVLLYGTIQIIYAGVPVAVAGEKKNTQEARFGVGFHF